MGAGSEYVVIWESRYYQPAIRGTVGGFLLVVCLGACQPEETPQKVQPLEQRVTNFWEARLQDDDLTAYQYEAYTRTGTMTATQYVRRRSPLLKYTEYAINEIQEQEDEALVKVGIKYQLTVPGMTELSLDSVVKERWARLDDGQWYRNNGKDTQPKPSRAAAKQG